MNDQDFVTNFYSYLLTEKCVSKNTFDAYKRDLEKFLGFINTQQVALKAISLEHFKEFLKVLKEEGLAARSMARKISTFKTFFGYLSDRHGFENAAEHLLIPRIEKKLPNHLTETEIEQLFSTADEDETPLGIRNKVMLYLLYVSGMRISELVHLGISDLDLASGFILIRGKGGKERMVPVPEPTVAMLHEYLNGTYLALITKDGHQQATEYLFVTYYGQELRPMTRQSFWMYLKKLSQQAGIQKDLSPHTLRHSLATHLLKNGAHLRSLQLLLGHEQLATVQIYTHMETSHLRKIYDEKHPRS